MNKYVTLKNAGDYNDFVFDIGAVKFIVLGGGATANAFTYTDLHVGDDARLRLVHAPDTGTPILSGVNGTAQANKLIGTGFGDGTTGPVFVGQIVFNMADETSALVTAVAETELTLDGDIFPAATGTSQAFVITDKTRTATLARKFQDLMVEVAVQPWQNNTFEVDCGIDITSFTVTSGW